MNNKLTDYEIIKALEEYSIKYNLTYYGKQAKTILDLFNSLQAENKKVAKEYMTIQNHYFHDTVAQYAENKGYLKALDDFEDRLSFIAQHNNKGKEYLEGFMDAMEIVDGFIRELKAPKVQTIKGDVQ